MTGPIHPRDAAREVWANHVLGVLLLAWFVAQGLKVLLGVLREKRCNCKGFVGTGGMPSSHAASVSSLATAVGFASGFHSPLFAIAAFVALVIMFDAQGVRAHTGKQAEVLNKILDDIYLHHEVREDRLKELLGHTPVEVMAGALLGIVVAIVYYSLNPVY